MRQLLILAIETPTALDIDHLALHVPRMIDGARGYGAILSDSFTAKAVAASAKECVEKLETDQNISLYPELSRWETASLGLKALSDMLPTLEGLDDTLRAQRAQILRNRRERG